MFFMQLIRLLCLILLLSPVSCISISNFICRHDHGRKKDKPRPGPPSSQRSGGSRP
ncbi:hypothetical protein MKX03_013884 [Papaver bracteatum]|nr:hypothetical protein MKX03_013884 [Papaver bracteatum]